MLCLPHVRGGVSSAMSSPVRRGLSSPRAWGCFFYLSRGKGPLDVFPTCVGVFLYIDGSKESAPRLPHVRGGVSDALRAVMAALKSSPRAWGCFPKDELMDYALVVFPTCVGVFLSVAYWLFLPAGLPHVRGGVSAKYLPTDVVGESSPRAWGCFSRTKSSTSKEIVFPTCVGVFPLSSSCSAMTRSLPHVRGGVSHQGRS